MKITFWGTRGSLPSPRPGTARYGGNTSCVELRPARRLGGASSTPAPASTAWPTPGPASPGRHPLDPPPHGPHPRPGVLRRAVPARPRGPHLGPAVGRRSTCGPGSRATSRRRCSRSGCATCRAGSCSTTPPGARSTCPARLGDRGARLPSRPDARLPHRRRRRHPGLHPGPRAGAGRRRTSSISAEWTSGFAADGRRRPADPRRAVHRRGVPGPRRLGPQHHQPGDGAGRGGRGGHAGCRSTTTPATTTTSSTGSSPLLWRSATGRSSSLPPGRAPLSHSAATRPCGHERPADRAPAAQAGGRLPGHAGVPGRRGRSAGVLQRTRRGTPRAALRGDRPDPPRELGQDLDPDRSGRAGAGPRGVAGRRGGAGTPAGAGHRQYQTAGRLRPPITITALPFEAADGSHLGAFAIFWET